MKSLNLPLLSPQESILKGLEAIDKSGFETALVVKEGRLVGLLTDGDARRALLAGHSLESEVGGVMQRRYTAVGPDVSRMEVLDIMKARHFKHVPVVDGDGNLLGLHLLHDVIGAENRPNAALIMCGGFGTRLRPLTGKVPKPMICVAGRPILERIVLHLLGHGFRKIFLAIHYLGEMIEEHFGDGSAFGCEIHYIREDKPLGTGGAIGLLPRLEEPFLVMNGDLVTQFDAARMLDLHMARKDKATVGVRLYDHEIPYGVLTVEGESVLAMKEKPRVEAIINSGIYVLAPEFRDLVIPGEEATVPALLETALQKGWMIRTMLIAEDWVDVGRHEELKRAQGIQV